MKKPVLAALALTFIIIFSSCSMNLTNKNAIIDVFNKNEESITEAVESGNFYDAMEIKGIYEVSVYQNYVDFQCGATGIVPSSSYYGFFYSPYNDPAVILGSGHTVDEFTQEGDGFIWNEPEGDNEFYVEKLAECFFYYEMHF